MLLFSLALVFASDFDDAKAVMFVRRPTKLFKVECNGVIDVAITDEGGKVAVADLDSLTIYKLPAGDKIMSRKLSLTPPVTCIAISTDGEHIATGHENGDIILYEQKRSFRAATLVGHRQELTEIWFSPDGRQLFSYDFKCFKIWDVGRRSCVLSIAAHSLYLSTCRVSLDGKYLFSVGMDNVYSSGTFKIWNLHDAKVIREIPDISRITQVAYIDKAKAVILAGIDGDVSLTKIYDKVLASIGSFTYPEQVIVGSSNPRAPNVFAFPSRNSFLIWDKGTRIFEGSLADKTKTTYNLICPETGFLRFSRNGDIVAVAHQRSVSFFALRTSASVP